MKEAKQELKCANMRRVLETSPQRNRTHVNVGNVLKQLPGDVFAAVLQGLRRHLAVRVPVSVHAVGVGGAGRGVVDPGGCHDAHRFT